jgi:hypothetical protein
MVLPQPAILIKFETLRRKTAFLGVYLGYKALGGAIIPHFSPDG